MQFLSSCACADCNGRRPPPIGRSNFWICHNPKSKKMKCEFSYALLHTQRPAVHKKSNNPSSSFLARCAMWTIPSRVCTLSSFSQGRPVYRRTNVRKRRQQQLLGKEGEEGTFWILIYGWLAPCPRRACVFLLFLLQCPVAQNTKGGVIVVNSPPLMQGREGNENTGDLLLFPPPLCPSPQSSLLSRAFNGCGRRHKENA